MIKYALFGKFTARSGQRDQLVGILLEAAALMSKAPGCDLYLVHTADDTDPDGVWVFETWADQASHAASLSIEGVAPLIQRALPLLAEPPTSGLTLAARGGHGLPAPGSAE